MPRRYLVLAICCMSLLIISLDVTVMNIALPAVRDDFGSSVAGLQWTIDAYALVIASLLVLSGSTADRVGRRRVFQIGLVLFTTASLLCSIAPSLGWLIAFRVLQAIGGSMLNPVAMSIITNTFTDPRERARAIGAWGAVNGFGLAIGPVVGGFLVHGLGWRSIFWINVPIGVAALVLTALFVPESRAPKPRRLDPAGQVLVFLLLASITFGIIEGPGRGWSSPEIAGCLALALLAFGGLLWWEPRRPEPLIELQLFRSPPFAGAVLIAICAFAALSGFLFLNTLYLQETRGLSALEAGLYTLPLAGASALFSPLSGRLVAARGNRLPLTVAGTGMALGMVPLTWSGPHTPAWQLLAGYLVFGIGFGMVNTPITNTAVAGMPRERAGVAAALASTSRQVGSALGVAVIGAALASGTGHAGVWILFGLGVTVLVLGRVSTGGWARSHARTPESVPA